FKRDINVVFPVRAKTGIDYSFRLRSLLLTQSGDYPLFFDNWIIGYHAIMILGYPIARVVVRVINCIDPLGSFNDNKLSRVFQVPFNTPIRLRHLPPLTGEGRDRGRGRWKNGCSISTAPKGPLLPGVRVPVKA
ncbi:MAG: hypothetical protein JW863_12525, partial [Chitinispirillaceae bacterium]|nr:hypothetical protein [Chitinispirillaceae bacterium]